MNIFFIADTHFGHKNVIKLSERPFNSIEEMNQTIIDNWNRKVKDEDIVYIVGDFAYKSEKSPVEIVRKLKGRKILIIGNHDTKALKDENFRKEFEEITYMKEIMYKNNQIVICHYPIVEWNGYFRGAYMVYAHIHNNVKNNAFKVMSKLNNALNAGVDINNFEPVTLEEMIENNRIFKLKYSIGD